MRYLIDTGADISVMPRLSSSRFTPIDLKLYAANGTAIKVYGSHQVIVDLGLRRRFVWPFLIADVRQAIIEANFLQKYKLLVDFANKRLVNNTTNLHSLGNINSRIPMLSTINNSSPYYQLLRQYIDITKPVPRCERTHDIQHYIITHGLPIAERARRLSPDKYKATKLAMEQMMQEGICEPVGFSTAHGSQ